MWKKFPQIFVLIVIVSFNFCSFGLAQDGASKGIYKFKSSYGYIASPTRNIVVEEEKKGFLEMKPKGKDASMTMVGDSSLTGVRYIPDALGAKNISIVVNEKVKYTTLAGLRFRSNCMINVWQDGTIEVDKIGVFATAEKNETQTYVSKEIKIGDRVYIVMVLK